MTPPYVPFFLGAWFGFACRTPHSMRYADASALRTAGHQDITVERPLTLTTERRYEMNTMNMPGFTAESSVYRTSGHYQMAAGFDANGGVVQLQACDVDCLRECPGGCGDLTGRQRAQCLTQCRNRCGCIPQSQVCGPCQCDPRTGWSQQCCRPDGTNCSQRPCTPPGEKDALSKIIVPAFPGRSTLSAGVVASGLAVIGQAATSCSAACPSANSEWP